VVKKCRYSVSSELTNLMNISLAVLIFSLRGCAEKHISEILKFSPFLQAK